MPALTVMVTMILQSKHAAELIRQSYLCQSCLSVSRLAAILTAMDSTDLETFLYEFAQEARHEPQTHGAGPEVASRRCTSSLICVFRLASQRIALVLMSDLLFSAKAVAKTTRAVSRTVTTPGRVLKAKFGASKPPAHVQEWKDRHFSSSSASSDNRERAKHDKADTDTDASE